jgi:N-acetyl sugar amidotransferase
MRFCTKCVTPDTRPDLKFDRHGVCDACRSLEKKHNVIDWVGKEKLFEELIDKHKNDNPLKYDCLIPVSGGKDSFFTLHHAIKHGLNPLCLVFEPTLPTEIGRSNLDALHKTGVDLIHFKRNPIVYDKMIMEGFKRVGDMEWANHMGIWSVPVHFAIKFDIPLILWGESPQMEYGGAETVSNINKKTFDEDWLNDYGCLNGLRPQDLVSEKLGITLNDIKMYVYPTKEEVSSWGGVGVFVGYYFKWNTQEQLDTIEELGWHRKRGRIEVSYTDHQKLDCLSMNLHDYLKYCKFGFGRASDSASYDIRNGYIQRPEGVRLAEKYDSPYPKKAVETFCDHFDISQKEFDRISDEFTNRAIFESKDGKFVRDIDSSLVMKSKYQERRKYPESSWEEEVLR